MNVTGRKRDSLNKAALKNWTGEPPSSLFLQTQSLLMTASWMYLKWPTPADAESSPLCVTSDFTIPATNSRTDPRIGGKSMAVTLTPGTGGIFNIPGAVGKCSLADGLIFFPGPLYELFGQISLYCQFYLLLRGKKTNKKKTIFWELNAL